MHYRNPLKQGKNDSKLDYYFLCARGKFSCAKQELKPNLSIKQN